MPAQRWRLWEEGRYRDPTQGRLSDTSSPAAIITSDLIILMANTADKSRHFFSGKGFC